MERQKRQELRRISWLSILSLGLLWLAGCTNAEAVQPTLVPTLWLPNKTVPETATFTPTATIVATFTPTHAAESVISQELVVTMGADQVRATDATRSVEEVKMLVEALPKPVTDASVALYAINLNSGQFELAGTGVVVEYDTANKRGLIMTARHVLEAASGAFLQNMQVGQPHKNADRITLNSSTMEIIPGPYGDVGFVEFEYEGTPPFPDLGRENIELDAILLTDTELGMLSFTDSAEVHTVYPVLNFGLSIKQPEFFDTQWNMRGYLIEPMGAKKQSGTPIVDMKRGIVVGILYGMHSNGAAVAPVLSGTFDVLNAPASDH